MDEPLSNGPFAAIAKAAEREESQSVSLESVAVAVKEDENLFQKEIRTKVLKVVKTLFDFALGLFLVTVAIRAWHLLVPQCGWLDPAHLKEVDDLLKSGLLVAIGGIGKELITNSLPGNKKAS